jgi:hypothetical protein
MEIERQNAASPENFLKKIYNYFGIIEFRQTIFLFSGVFLLNVCRAVADMLTRKL